MSRTIDPIDIQRLRDLPIEEVAQRLGLEVSRHKTLCPFHPDKHPSLTFDTRRNCYRCWSCGAHGDVIDLVMKLLPNSFAAACSWLNGSPIEVEGLRSKDNRPPSSARVTIPPPYGGGMGWGFPSGGIKGGCKSYPPDVEYLTSLVSRPVLNAEAHHFLFDERRYNPKVIEWLGISSISRPSPCWRYGRAFYDAPSLLFPYRDIYGRVMNVQSRYLGHESGKPRFRFPSNSPVHIFNLPILRYLKSGEPLFISEGVTDCIAMLSSGHKAIAIPSATLLNPADLEAARGHPLICYPDRDAAGDRLYHQLLNVATDLGSSLLKRDLPEGCKDFSDYYRKSPSPRTPPHPSRGRETESQSPVLTSASSESLKLEDAKPLSPFTSHLSPINLLTY